MVGRCHSRPPSFPPPAAIPRPLPSFPRKRESTAARHRHTRRPLPYPPSAVIPPTAVIPRLPSSPPAAVIPAGCRHSARYRHSRRPLSLPPAAVIPTPTVIPAKAGIHGRPSSTFPPAVVIPPLPSFSPATSSAAVILPTTVIPAKAGIQKLRQLEWFLGQPTLDSRFRGNDGLG